MQLFWLAKGLKTGIVTTRYPAAPEAQPSGWRGRLVLDPAACRAADGCADCAAVCLPQAISATDGRAVRSPGRLMLDYGRCILCGLCVPACPAGALYMVPDYELAVRDPADLRVELRSGAAEGGTDGRR